MGSGVEAFWGSGLGEYEWVRTIRPSELPKVRDALGGDATIDVLDLIARWCAEHTPEELEPTLERAGVEMEIWNRVGD